MGFVYAGLWFLTGLVLIFSLAKEHKIIYFAGGFFILLGAWWLLDSLWPDTNLFGGSPGTILRILTFAALVVLSVFFLIERRKTLQQIADEQKKPAQTAEQPVEEETPVEQPTEEPAEDENDET